MRWSPTGIGLGLLALPLGSGCAPDDGTGDAAVELPRRPPELPDAGWSAPDGEIVCTVGG